MGAHHFPIVSHHFPVYIYILCKFSYIFFTFYQKVHFLKVIKMVVSSVSKPRLDEDTSHQSRRPDHDSHGLDQC